MYHATKAKENADPYLTNFQPPRMKAKSATRPAGACFKAPITDDEIAIISNGYVLQNTQKNTAWALGVFL